MSPSQRHHDHHDVLIIGGGTMGLAIAIELALAGAHPTVLSRNFQEAALHAAAGMLAPQAEDLPPGPLLDLCCQSRDRYPTWITKLEQLTGLDAGYWPCGILAPVLKQSSHQVSPTLESPILEPALESGSRWLDRAALDHQQPGLGETVEGAWWFPADGQVDNRALAQVLRTAVTTLGIPLIEGIEVQGWQTTQGRVESVLTNQGTWAGDRYVLATGAWSQNLLPIPVTPRKGQMLALQTPGDRPLPFSQVIYGDQIYLVPRRSGKIIVGATSETVGFKPGNTVEGIHALLAKALTLYPGLADFELMDTWWGYRPATPDEGPILGESPWQNLYLATGHYRNGILLAPITAHVITDLLLGNHRHPLLGAFSYGRFRETI
ncbi:glycine oxidase ThiO [Candidatus Synechococcus calcipolaris G9]|uniref:glycine oxidase n=1 Tax=Candidatus Synechococcus calcipolaris G9 TaxID=1497997 RepID=A0ABT6EYL9_9SYNE|nr:glycine oxidase ThiO [Candidatus Synechococcus calcipolaris]MDG2990005.1 glycine oxidase ThiO [Candidatus Synechococcus calcipolaris G9]